VTITPRGVSKGSGLRELTRLLGIHLSETIAVGDNLNDLDMLSTAGLGVVMENATPEAKAQADYVTGSNNEDGVAQVIERFIL
jgi:hydroxymethylpyrimidine pyrophosphatase-like HAD family hydrolase